MFISFNPFRTLGIPEANYIKPENMLEEKLKIKRASWLLFPEYWQVNSLVYGWQKRIFPSISTYHLGHDKIEMTRLFQLLAPGNTPYTMILANDETAKEQILDKMSFPFVGKKVRSSEGRGVWLIKDKDDLNKYLAENQVLYLQEYLPIDRDLRVVYVGDEVFTAYWRIGKEGDFRNNLAQGGSISHDNIPEEPLRLVRDIARQAGIDHAGFDIAALGGHYYLLEFNLYFGNTGLAGRSQELNKTIYRYLLHKTEKYNPDDTDRNYKLRSVK